MSFGGALDSTMSKKTTATRPSSFEASKKAKKISIISTTNAVPNWAQPARGNHHTPRHLTNKYGINVVDQYHMMHYDLVALRKIREIKYIDIPFIESIGLWNNVCELLEVVGWVKYMQWDKPIYKRLC